MREAIWQDRVHECGLGPTAPLQLLWRASEAIGRERTAIVPSKIDEVAQSQRGRLIGRLTCQLYRRWQRSASC